MKTKLLFFLIFFMIKSFSQTNIFEKFNFIGTDGDTLLYRLAKPDNLDKHTLYPLIIFLHGSGERGSDNQKQLIHIEKVFADSAFRKNYPCYIIAPQCPLNKRWVEVDWDAQTHTTPEEPSVTIKVLGEAIGNLSKTERIDETRIYITGLSMGGYGTWDLISRFPDIFAAAVPICGGGDEKDAPKLAKVPIWNFHGTLDKAVDVNRSRNMINAIRKAGGNPVFTEYSNGTHNVWTMTYNNQLLWDWLFAQKLIK